MFAADAVKMGRKSVTGQHSAEQQEVRFSRQRVAETPPFSPLIQARNTCASRQIRPKASRKLLVSTFPDTSLFIKVVGSLERKIDERQRSSTRRMGRLILGRQSAAVPPPI
jgi:hypothetical protein